MAEDKFQDEKAVCLHAHEWWARRLRGPLDAWKDHATGEWLQTFAVVTTFANKLTGKVHDRMPVILHPRDYDRWLDRGDTVQLPTDLLRPYEVKEMQADPFDPAVRNVRDRRC